MKTILVVDDEQDICTYLSRLFRENGYAVECAGDGIQALEEVRKKKPDLITLDLSMPNKSGVRFYREVRADPNLSTTPVVLVTGVTGPGGDSAATERFYKTRLHVPPPDGFIAKPVVQAEIIDVVRRLIGPGEEA